MDPNEIIIRCSSLPAYQDCPRRSIARGYPDLLRRHGFSTRRTGCSIGAAIGTGAHAGASHLLISKREGYSAIETEAVEIGITTLESEASKSEVIFDDRTKNRNDAQSQIKTMTAVFYHTVLPAVEPTSVECQRRAKISDGVFLAGRSDLETKTDELHDLKFGAVPRFYLGQFGGYSLLRRSHGGCIASKLLMDHIPRVRVDKPQPPVSVIEYNLTLAEQAAWATIQFLVRDYRAFESSGDPWTIPANPSSPLCSEKYCAAYGTDFCTLKGKI